MNSEEIFSILKKILVDEFQVEADLVSPEKSFYDDLELDSLDAVDLLISLKDYTGEKIDPGLFKNAKTIQEMADLLKPLWK